MSEFANLIEKVEKALEKDEDKDALRDVEAAIELEPASAKAWFLKGRALFGLDDFTGAIDAVKTAIDNGIEGEDLENAKALLDESNKKQILKSVRRDWYQTDTHVIVTVLIKKVKADDVSVNYTPDSLDFSVKIPDKDVTYELKMALEKKIDPETSAFKITPSKIEIRLKKADGFRWTNLGEDKAATKKHVHENPPPYETVPNYPTSSKTVKNWDRLEKEVVQEEKDEKLEGDAALNKLFQQIYGDASEETKRAMNKSFQESNGTVLSTNWKDISEKKTEMQCPDGMEYKKY